ncbi:SEC-C domain-containing protein [Cohnella terricola]|nr:SEC-C domain-containing protein [Cohnella terricola]
MGNGQKRNDPCICGSGKKYKNCCLHKKNYIPISAIRFPETPEPFLNFVPSTEYQDHKIRAIWNTLHFRPPRETFHEFLILFAYKMTYGKDFHEQQLPLLPQNRHVTFKWWMAYCDWGVNNSDQYVETEHGKIYFGKSTGEVQSLLQHAFDLFCLQTVNRLPDFFIDRLKDTHEFQGVRYEVAVAAIMARAGFDIEFLDDKHKSEAHCEFIATHRESGQKIGVEAKSKRRKGVLHEDGVFDAETDFKGNIKHLFRKARTQKPEGIPFIIFIDMNLPSTSVNLQNLDIEPEKTWENDIDQIYANYKSKQSLMPDPFNALYFTNFAFYYSGNESVSNPWVTYIKKSDSPEHKISDMTVLDSILNSITRYSVIPKEI